MRVTQNQLHQRFTAAFAVLCLCAIAVQIAGIVVPYWYEAGGLYFYDAGNPTNDRRYLMYQGMFSDYRCTDAENTDCVVIWHVDYNGWDGLKVPNMKEVRGLELAALAWGVLSFVGLLALMCSYTSSGCRKLLPQGIFSLSSLAAGFLAILGVLVLVANTPSDALHWAVALPTIAAFCWLFNGAFSFVVCRYDPKHFRTEHVLIES